MMIIKEGVIVYGFEGKWRCTHCGCEWEMVATDPKPKESNDQRDGNAFHMPCPTCSKDTWRQTPRVPGIDDR